MPRLLQMANMRRGVASAAALDDLDPPARAGRIASSQGSASATPAPRRKLRRESGPRCEAKNPAVRRSEVRAFMTPRLQSLVQEQFALDDFMDQVSHAKTLGLLACKNLLNHRSV